jgi:hypothetical protein
MEMLMRRIVHWTCPQSAMQASSGSNHSNICVARKLKATGIIEALCELFVSRGILAHIR